MKCEAVRLVELLTEKRLRIVVAESCTGGLIGSLLAAIPGASDVFWGGFTTYTVDAKQKMLGIDAALLERYGAVSEECARAMSASALKSAKADIALSVTGLAGPGGDGSLNPVGTVWVGGLRRGVPPLANIYHFAGSRGRIRAEAAAAALKLGIYLAEKF
ncbi:MAG: nicotinamide-nucleotide amidohydrolase family protein [Spirochaetaceae bacterium]|jgi:PncC family amidohydrolase|nr:nicotinamide-nucleotide amidohydrolase family protein [Spirochaetaceae bacterium]